jgi:glycine oxidase
VPDLIIVGGGIIGLSIAHRAQQRGAEVLVLDDPEARPPAAGVAAGMLAPVTEADFGEDPALGLESLEKYPAWCDELGVELRRTGTLVVARDADDAAVLDRLHAYRAELGLAADRLLPSRARRLEPALAPTLRLALDVPTDAAVDPRALLAALRARVPVRDERVERVDALDAETVVLAAGAWSGGLADVPVRPVKGQILRLRDPRGAGLIDRTIRTLDAYLVPRGDGRYVLGGTVEDVGWDAQPTARGVFELLRDMSEVVPGVLGVELEEVAVGFRPATPSTEPVIERRGRVVIATGHWRNGVLLAPATADRVVELIEKVPAA